MAVNIRQQVSPNLIFFIISGSQIGVGVLGFQRDLAKYAGYDSWISVILAGFIVQIIIWLFYKLLNATNGDIFDAHKQFYGNFLGSILSFIIIIYYWIASISVLRLYIEIVQVWMFPSLPIWLLSTLILILCFYIISGGFRVVTGIAFLSGIFTILLYGLLFHMPMKYIHFDNLLPFLDHSMTDIFLSAKQAIYTMAGFEILLIAYPFIRHGKNSQKFAHLAIGFSTLIFTLSAISSFLIINEEQMKHVIWARIYIAKLIHLPFLERFEYILISTFLIKVISILALFLWGTSRGIKLIFKFKQKYALILISIVCIITCQLLVPLQTINKFINLTSKVSLWLIYIYIPIFSLLFILIKPRRTQ